MRSCVVALYEILAPHYPGPCLVPANVCPTLIAALLDAKGQVQLGDTDISTGLANDSVFAQRIEKSNQPGIVMLVQSYGYLREFPLTLEAACRKGWFVVENDTMAVRSSKILGGQPSQADALLVSFGSGKALSGAGGGALFLREQTLKQEADALMGTYPVFTPQAQARDSWLIQARRLLRQGPDGAGSYLEHSDFLLPMEKGDLRHRFHPEMESAIFKAIETFPMRISKAMDRLNIWHDELGKYDLPLIELSGFPVSPPRMVFRLNHQRNEVVRHLRYLGFDVGTNYPNVREYFPGIFEDQNPDFADQWSDEVVNLWVSEDYDQSKIAAGSLAIASNF